MLTNEDIMKMLTDSGALLSGHFLLSSGLHSDTYIQCAVVLQYPEKAEKLCSSLAAKVQKYAPDIVIGPALGGIIAAYETARALKIPAIFSERKDEEMQIRRGFKIEPGQRVLVVEDVVTTGGSSKEVIDIVLEHGGEVTAAASLIDRSSGAADFPVPFESLLTVEVASYKPEDCPLCKAGSTPVKPGSRS